MDGDEREVTKVVYSRESLIHIPRVVARWNRLFIILFTRSSRPTQISRIFDTKLSDLD